MAMATSFTYMKINNGNKSVRQGKKQPLEEMHKI